MWSALHLPYQAILYFRLKMIALKCQVIVYKSSDIRFENKERY